MQTVFLFLFPLLLTTSTETEVLMDDIHLSSIHLSISQKTSWFFNDEIIWGANTENIRNRVLELCEESSMFNQIFIHLKQSELPFSVIRKKLNTEAGIYSSKNGHLFLDEKQLPGYIFDATIIEEFVHAYQSLYYNYSHGIWKHKMSIKKPLQRKEYLKNGLKNWLKYGRKTAFIESEAKLLTFFIQHQTCSITMDDIKRLDKLNTGGKGRKLITKYLERKSKQNYRRKKMGHLNEFNQIDINVFSNYQKLFIRHWMRGRGLCTYTKGYFFHKPEALNKVYESIENNRFRSY